MLKVLLPTDGSEASERAVTQVVRSYRTEGPMEVHLLNVQIPIESGHARMFVSEDDIESYYREEAVQQLQRARHLLDEAGVPHTDHIAVGHVADTIARYASEKGMDRIVMGTHGRSGLTHLLLGSVATDVLRASSVPVMLVK